MVRIQKYAKAVVTTILMTLPHLLEDSGAPLFTLQQRGLITAHKRRLFLFERGAKCSLHNSACVGLKFVLRHPGGVDLTVTEHFL